MLAVDDDPLARYALAAVLDATGADIVFAASGEAALEQLADGGFAAVILDIGMPGLDGFEVAREIKSSPATSALPIIFLTGHVDERELRRGYALGAVDYLLKPIEPAVLRAKVETFVDLARLRQEAAALTHRALHDPLTGLPNRTLFLDRLDHALQRLAREPGLVGVLFLDLDGFKDVNDRFGHDAGDRLLIEVAQRLQAAVRAVDTPARFGGDEFLVLCEHLDDADELEAVADRIAAGLRREMPVAIGSATTSDPLTTAEELIREADLAMLATKVSQRA